jgi:hypothetical protein
MNTDSFHLKWCFVVGAGLAWLVSRAGRLLRSRLPALGGLVAAVVGLSLITVISFHKPRSITAMSTPACIANLHQMRGAIATWAMEYQRSDTDIPEDPEIFGPASYIKVKPTCPEGGTYLLAAARGKPICTHGGSGHQLETPLGRPPRP